MSYAAIQLMLLDFPQAFASKLWEFSEEAHVPIGDFAPIVFGLTLGSVGVKVED